jgi:NADPH:quinone reductase-like Zn-dependent oxidoreductase
LKDVATALGIVATRPGQKPLGIEFSGVVKRVGQQVTDLKVGERIFGLTDKGALASTVRITSSVVRKIPDELSFVDAATMPCCFTTVLQSIMEVGQMKTGQVRLLIVWTVHGCR